MNDQPRDPTLPQATTMRRAKNQRSKNSAAQSNKTNCTIIALRNARSLLVMTADRTNVMTNMPTASMVHDAISASPNFSLLRRSFPKTKPCDHGKPPNSQDVNNHNPKQSQEPRVEEASVPQKHRSAQKIWELAGIPNANGPTLIPGAAVPAPAAPAPAAAPVSGWINESSRSRNREEYRAARGAKVQKKIRVRFRLVRNRSPQISRNISRTRT